MVINNNMNNMLNNSSMINKRTGMVDISTLMQHVRRMCTANRNVGTFLFLAACASVCGGGRVDDP